MLGINFESSPQAKELATFSLLFLAASYPATYYLVRNLKQKKYTAASVLWALWLVPGIVSIILFEKLRDSHVGLIGWFIIPTYIILFLLGHHIAIQSALIKTRGRKDASNNAL